MIETRGIKSLLTCESLRHERENVLFQVSSSETGGDIDYALKECVSQKPVTIIEVCNHMAQKNVICLLSLEKDT